jgi:hypothetical protein
MNIRRRQAGVEYEYMEIRKKRGDKRKGKQELGERKGYDIEGKLKRNGKNMRSKF